ncbi:hypothetical protein ABZP36_027419 [Zizania latifolia]
MCLREDEGHQIQKVRRCCRQIQVKERGEGSGKGIEQNALIPYHANGRMDRREEAKLTHNQCGLDILYQCMRAKYGKYKARKGIP